MDTDPILRLMRKIENVKKVKEKNDEDLLKDETALQELTEQVSTKEKEIEEKNKKMKDSETKLQRVEYLIAESEKSLRRIIETSLALDKVLEQEGCGI
jgi:uncharacterized protein HemX